MKIVRLTAHRVRVFISEGDLLDMHMDLEHLTPDSPELNVFLGEILKEVREETGFSVSDGKVLAEATPDRKGIILDFCHIPEKEKEQDSSRAHKRESIVFELSGFEPLAEMLKNISGHQVLGMRLYSMGEKFYVSVPKKRAPAIMYEYSLKNSKSPVAESKLSEYGRLVAGGYGLMQIGAMLKKIN